MKLSIIVPVYKVEPYLRRCVDSILAQTFTDYELILVDDGSPDNCPSICDEYARKDRRIVVIHKENGGLSDARNAGLDIARGDYIGFVDSDDLIHPQMYEILLHFAEKEKVDVIQCDVEIFTGYRIPAYQCYDYKSAPFSRWEKQDVLNHYYQLPAQMNSPVWKKLYKKSIFHDVRFPVGRLFEDAAIHLATIEKMDATVLIPFKLYYYYQNPSGIMQSGYSKKKMLNICFNNVETIDFFRTRGIKEQEYFAIDDFATRYCRDKMAVYLKFPEYKEAFSVVDFEFRKELRNVLQNPYICKMKKIMLICTYISPKLAYRICKKLFPECLYEFMR